MSWRAEGGRFALLLLSGALGAGTPESACGREASLAPEFSLR